jgi:hypothetical protein
MKRVTYDAQTSRRIIAGKFNEWLERETWKRDLKERLERETWKRNLMKVNVNKERKRVTQHQVGAAGRWNKGELEITLALIVGNLFDMRKIPPFSGVRFWKADRVHTGMYHHTLHLSSRPPFSGGQARFKQYADWSCTGSQCDTLPFPMNPSQS